MSGASSHKLRSIKEAGDLSGRRVLLRLDLNVTVKDGNVTEDFRIKRSLPTLNFLSKSGARTMIMSHIDKKEGGSLEPLARYLLNFFPGLRFVKDLTSEEAHNEVNALPQGGMILFENLRQFEGEKNNDPQFARKIASLGEIYVNDAFAVSHRSHASIVGVPVLLPSFAGFLLEEEVENLQSAFHPERPFLFILGGAKFETKIPLLSKYIDIADNIFIGGAIANDAFKAKGWFVGESVVSENPPDLSRYVESEKVLLPIDVITLHRGIRYRKKPSEVSVGERISDCGERSLKILRHYIDEASLIVWNGPLGNIEAGFADGTKMLAEMMALSRAKTIIGGGDSIAVINKMGFISKFSFVSTGGGAMLDYLANETLPGIEALK